MGSRLISGVGRTMTAAGNNPGKTAAIGAAGLGYLGYRGVKGSQNSPIIGVE
jgi:hypothetical protein